MLILTIRTDKPESELGLYENEKKLTYKTWHAHRKLAETIHQQIQDILSEQSLDWHAIKGIVVFQGPGSFTGLRIGLSVANALAASMNLPITGSTGDDWQARGIKDLLSKAGKNYVMPEYGTDVYTTMPKK